MEEREEIVAGGEGGHRIREIASALSRAPSTVMRELRRNMGQHYRTRSRLSNGGSAHRTLSPRPGAKKSGPHGVASEADEAGVRPFATRVG